MNTYFTRYYRGVILNVKLLFLIILLISLFACEQKKKSIIHTPNSFDIILFYVFTGGGASLMNNCDQRFKYQVINSNQVVIGTDSFKDYKVNNLKNGSTLIVRNLSLDTNCIAYMTVDLCDQLNNQHIEEKICLNQNSYYLRVIPDEIEKVCILDYKLISTYRNSLIFSLGLDKSKVKSTPQNCNYTAEVKL